MNKNDLISVVSDSTQMSRKDADVVITAVLDAITEALSQGEKVQLVGFGSFEVKYRAARVGRNLKTGEEMEIPAVNTPVFKPGKALKDAVAQTTN